MFLTRRYQRMLAAVMSLVMTAMPVTAMAAGTAPEEDLTFDVQFAILTMEESALQESLFGEDTVLPEEPELDSQKLTNITDPNAVTLVYNGFPLELDNYARLYNGVTCVPVRDYFEAMGCTVSWDLEQNKIFITREDGLQMELQPGSRVAKANGRCWYMTAACAYSAGVTMIPLRDAAKVFNGEVIWEKETKTAYITGAGLLESGDTYYNQEDLLWIARIVRHESCNQPLDGKVAVANVIINRMNHPGFPSTAEEVIYDTRNGVQFVKRSSKSILKDPCQTCWLAAKLALEGYETAPDCLYFASNKVAPRCWAGRNRQVALVIGGHTFFY